MAETKSIDIPLGNKGIVTTLEPRSLTPGQLFAASNIDSIQENSICSRRGIKLPAVIDNVPQPVDTIGKSHLGGPDVDNPRYVSSNSFIYRTTDLEHLTEVADGTNSTLADRIGIQPYNAGATGDTYTYFATPSAMLRDYNRTPYSTLQNWGILPPLAPAQAALAAPYAVNICGTEAITTSSTSAYETLALESGALNLSQFGANEPSGNISNGFSNSDYFALVLTMSTSFPVSDINDIRLQFDVGDGTFTNYYEKDIIPSQLTPAVTEQTPYIPAIQVSSNLVDYQYNPANIDTNQAYPIQLTPQNLGLNQTINIAKQDFVAVGRAGQINSYLLNWASVAAVRLIVKSNVSGYTLTVGSLNMYGGSGPNASGVASGTATITPYTYLYTFYNQTTGTESNPSQPMESQYAVTPNNQPVYVICWGTGDVQVTGSNSIRVYRGGGAFTDGLFRYVGSCANPGSLATVTFTDNSSDTDLIYTEEILEYDNDAPVTSTLPVPFITTVQTGITIPTVNITGATNAAPIVLSVASSAIFSLGQNVTVQTSSPAAYDGSYVITAITMTSITLNNTVAPGSAYVSGATISPTLPGYQTLPINATIPNYNPGTLVTITSPTNSSLNETVVIIETLGRNIRAFFQNIHLANDVIEVDAVVGQPCNYVAAISDSLFLAGDTNNPQVLYKSKSGRPENWPLVNLETGNANQLTVGSPSNPIQNILELRGQIVCMNLKDISIVDVINGAMLGPYKTAAARGLFAPWAWCVGDQVVYYLAYDGIYAFDGSQSSKITGHIDWLFNYKVVNGVQPIDMNGQYNAAAPNYLTMAFYRGALYLTYMDITGTVRRLKGSVIHSRWLPQVVSGNITAMFTEIDTGYMLVSSAIGIGFDEQDGPQGTTDFWIYTGIDGETIPYFFQTGFFDLGNPQLHKVINELFLELDNPDQCSVSIYYDYSVTADPVDQFTIPANPNPGQRYFYPIPLQQVTNPLTTFGKEATSFSIYVSGTASHINTFYSLRVHYFDLSETQLGRITDWMDYGSPFDKRPTTVTFEYNTYGNPVTICMDTMTGINGNVISTGTNNAGVQQFVLNGTSRSIQTFAINDGIIVKAVRFRPLIPGTQFELFNRPELKFESYPPDFVPFTPWDSLGWQCDKTLRVLELDVDTGGVQATCNIQLDGATAYSFPVTTTFNNRNVTITLPSNLNGRNVRLLNNHGAGGKFQLFRFHFDFIAEPCAVTHWDSYETAHGYDGWKFIYQMWIEYICEVSINVTIITDTGTFVQNLPAQSTRAVARFYLPSVFGSGYNKSKVYRYQIDASDGETPFKFYPNGSRVEIMKLGSALHASFVQEPLSPEMKPIANG